MGKKVISNPKGDFGSVDETDKFFNEKLWIEFHHVPSGQYVEFKAFLTDFSDNYESSWNEEEVYGRNDPLLTFEGTRRDISLGWKVLAKDPIEARENMKRVSTLINFLYPHYDVPANRDTTISSTAISAAPLLKIRMINWIQDVSGATDPRGYGRAEGTGLLGKPDGISFQPNLDEGFIWADEIPVSESDTGDEVVGYRLFPKEFELSMNFTVNHQHALGWTGQRPRQSNFPYGERLKGKTTSSDTKDFIVIDESGKETSTDQQANAANEEVQGGSTGTTGGSGPSNQTLSGE